MTLGEILKDIKPISITGDTVTGISGISYDSRKVRSGHLFIAMHGEKSDGHHFIGDAIKNGALAIVYDNPAVGIRHSEDNNRELKTRNSKLSFIHVSDSRAAAAHISNNFFMRPSDSLHVIGVTGTNGKTTSAYIIKSILEAWGRKVGLIGTIKYIIDDETYDAAYTTPEALEFQGLLHKMREKGCTHVVSEVSSHALAQKRVDGTVFKTGVFTNLTRDHLDFHKTMENYCLAKERLFKSLLAEDGGAVINFDDVYGKRLVSELRTQNSRLKTVLTYGLETGSDLVASEIGDSFDGLRFRITLHGEKYEVSSPLLGLPNVYNILSAAGVSVSLGIGWDTILDGIKRSGDVKGRFERVDAGQKFLAIVDFAHTEDALERLIYTARGLTSGKVITVFGCGGDRDRGKRPGMGAIATRLSDFVVITSDNPRTEDPEKIIGEIVGGAARKNYLVEPDRKEAIKRAVLIAEEKDIVLVAGKGHEDYQETVGKRSKFSDRDVIEEAVSQLINNK